MTDAVAPSVPSDRAAEVVALGRLRRSVPEVFADAVSRHADRVAVTDGGDGLTYAELDARANGVAAALRASGLEPSSHRPVAVLSDHGPHAVIAMLGIAKAGGRYVVLDARAPRDFLASVITRLQPSLLLRDGPHDGVATTLGVGRVIDLDELGPADDPRVAIDPDSPLMISFTSGSSGRPKAVVHSHRNVVANGLRVGAVLDVLPEDRILGSAPFAYVASSTSTYAALLSGAALCTYDFPSSGSAAFATFATHVGLTVAQVTPAVLLDLPHRLAAGQSGPAGVRLVMTGGDRVGAEHIHAVSAYFPSAEMLMRYSTSETNWVTGSRIHPRRWEGRGTVPIGWPVPWIQTRLLDAAGTAVAASEIGELAVSGDALALGYVGDDSLTAARFRDGPSGREYRTGDRVRRLPDGQLEFIGRADRVAKVRGMLVDLAAVEQEMHACPGVTSAAVVVAPASGDGVPLLVGFATGRRVRSHAVRGRLSRRLPHAMVPSDVVHLPELPLTVRGKVDRAALVALAAARLPPEYLEPEGDVEVTVAGLFATALNLPTVGRDDDFFTRGGDSLASVELLAAIDDRLGVPLAHSDLLSHPTPRLLAQSLTDNAATSRRRGARLVKIRSGPPDSVPVILCSGGGGGHLEGMANLARELSSRDCYVSVPRSFEHRGGPDRTIAAMATGIVRDAPGLGIGPDVILIGHSSGGTVALEAARQFDGAGVRVPMVVLLDTVANTPAVRRRRTVRNRMRRDAERKWAARSRDGLSTGAVARAVVAARSVMDLVRFWMRARTAGWIARTGRRRHKAFQAVVKFALARHVEAPYDGPVLLVTARRRGDGGGSGRAERQWGDVLRGPVEIRESTADHAQLTRDPFVTATASVIDEVLRRYAD